MNNEKLFFKLVSILFFMFFSIDTAYANIDPMIKNFSPTKQELENGAVVLKKNRYITIDKEGKQTVKDYYLIAILNDEAARDYGQIDFPFNSFYQNRKLDFARVIRPNGSIKELDREAIQIINPQNYNTYDDTKTIIFSLPSIETGTFIEFQLTGKDKKNIIENETSGVGSFMLWHTNKSTNHMRVDSVRESKYVIEINKGKKLYYHADDKASFSKTEMKSMIKYTWSMKNLKKVKVELSTLNPYNKIIPHITYSTMPDWTVLNSYFYKAYDRASELNRKIYKLANKIVEKNATDKEKIISLFNYVQNNIKYIFAHLGKGGMLPHHVDNIMQNAYGDCKDQTTLYIALLKAVNIEAYPALISTYPGDFERQDTVSPKYFNHVITYIPKSDLWVDTTGYSAVFPGISWLLGNKKSFVLDNKGGKIKQIPDTGMQSIKIDLELKIKGKELIGEMHYLPSAQISDFYKAVIANTQNATLYLEKDFNSFYQNALTDSFEILHANNAEKLLEIIWKFKIPMENEVFEQYVFSSVLNGFLMKNLPISLMERPKYRVYGFKHGYKIKFDIKTIYRLPNKKYKLKIEPSSPTINNEYYEYQFSYQENIDHTITHDLFTFKKNEIQRKEYKDFYEKSKKILQDVNYIMIFTKDKFRQKEMNLKKSLSKEQSSEKMIALAEYYLDVSNYEESKKLIEKVIAKEPKNAKAHYIYGIILGYMDVFDESGKEFQKARDLGYEK